MNGEPTDRTGDSIPQPPRADAPSGAHEGFPGDDVVPHPEKPPSVLATLRAAREALRPIGRRRLLRAVLVVSGLLFFGVVVFGGFSMWWTSQPSFCGRCHVMDKYIDAWEASPHEGVNCERCHTPTGTLGFLGGKIAGLQVVVNYFRGHYEDNSFNAAVPNANCLQCHSEILEHDVKTKELRVRHKEIVENGGKCMFCHSVVAHGSAVPFGSRTEPTMGACFKCHDGETAPLDCATCHRTRPIGTRPESHEPSTTTTG